MMPYQLLHLAACADEESLVDSQRCVDCSGIQLQLGSLCVGFTGELLASHTDHEISAIFIFFCTCCCWNVRSHLLWSSS